jgi:very-short-patch-repair endonuclease
MASEPAPRDPGSRRKRPNRRSAGRPRDVPVAPERDRPTLDATGADWDVSGPVGWPDRAIAQVAASQRALITRAQLVELGVGLSAIEHALKRGRLHRIHQGIYSLTPFSVLPPLATELAAVLACGDRALLSHHSAAAVWGIRPAIDGDIDITVVGKETGRRRPGIQVHRTRSLARRDALRYQQLPITSAARTLLDIAPHTSTRSLEWAIDQALTKRLTNHTAITAVLAAYPHAAGIARLRALTNPDRPTTLTRSHPEERLLQRIRNADLPIPEANVKVGNYTADFYWRQEGVVLEIDGYHYHHTRTAFERDHQRDTEHQRHDIVVIRVTPRQVEHNLDAVLVHIAVTLERRRQRPAA